MHAGTDLDDYCGRTVWASTSTHTLYKIRDSNRFNSSCRVDFRSISRRVHVTIAGASLDTSRCRINVFGSSDLRSLTGGDVQSYGNFIRTVTSDDSGILYLHVEGSGCGSFGLTFTLFTSCLDTDFTCDSGQCVWSGDVCDGFDDCDDGSDEDGCFWDLGTYLGVGVGVFVFVTLLSAVAVFVRYRRVRLMTSRVLIPRERTVVTAAGQSTYHGQVNVVGQTPVAGQAAVNGQSIVTQTKW